MKNTMLASILLFVLVVSGSASAELTGTDIGKTWPPNPAGSLTVNTPGSDYTVQAAGRDIWETADSFHYAYQPVLVTGDFEAIVRVDSLLWLHDPLNVHQWSKACIMARANLTDDSAHAIVCRSGHNGVHMQARQITGRHSITKDLGSGDVFGSPIWVKLARRGNVFAAWWAQDIAGAPGPWQNPYIMWVDMPPSVFVGLATTSHLNTPPDNVVTAVYRKFSIAPFTDFPPIPNFGPFPGPEGGGGYIGIREVIDNGVISNQDNCNDSLTSGTGTIVDYTAPVLNIHDSGLIGHFTPDNDFGVVTAGHRILGSVDYLSMVAKGAVEIPADGYYTFCITSDDGFTLQFPGYDFTGITGGGNIIPYANGSALQLWAGRPLDDTLGTIYLPAGHHPFVLTYHEELSGSALEFSVAPGARVYFDGDFLLVGSSDVVAAKPPVPNPPTINYGAGWPVTMVYEPHTTGTNYSDELDSAIVNVEAAWAGALPTPNLVVNATVNWLNFEDPQAGGGGKGFLQEPFPGSDDAMNNDRFAMGAGARTSYQLYAIRDSFDGTYTININTGVPTLIGPSGVSGGTCGLSHSGGSVLYGSIPFGMSVIQTDGSGVSVLGGLGMEGMAYDRATGTLYGAINNQFFTVDTVTGSMLTTLPNWPDDCEGLAFVPSVGAQGSVYGLDDDGELHRYDVATGTFSLVGNTGLGIACDNSGLAYAPHLDILFHITRNDGDLYRIDKNTAAATFIANTGIIGFTGFSGLAYGPAAGTGMVSPVTLNAWQPGIVTKQTISSDGEILDLSGQTDIDISNGTITASGASATSKTISVEYADPEGTGSKGPGTFTKQTLQESTMMGSSTIVVETASPISGSVLAILDSIPHAYDFVDTYDLSTIDFSPYNIIILGMDGGSTDEADMAHLANYVNAGAKLIILGGSSTLPFAQGLNDNFIQVNVANYFWTTVSGIPDLTVVNSAHPLAAGLPATYDFVNNSATFYMARITDSMATVVAENGDGYPSLVYKPIGLGGLIYFINSPTEYYWTDAGDYAILQQVLLNALQFPLATTINIYEEGDYTFLIYSDDSVQFRILDLEGGDPYAWTINSAEMTPGNEIVRLDDGTGFRFHGCCVDAKGTIHLTPGDYRVQVIFNERGGYSYFGLWCSKDGSRIFLLGDSTPVPTVPDIHALGLVCPYQLFGDVNHDCAVNFLDVAVIGMNWLIDCSMNPGDPACIHK